MELNKAIIGYLVAEDCAQVNQLLLSVAQQLQQQGYVVRGLLRADQYPANKRIMQLQELATKQKIVISQDLGSGSVSCRIDTSQLAQAAQLLAQAVQAETDIIFLNRYSKLEANGGGFINELAQIVLAEIPLIVLVEAACLAQWNSFHAGLAQALPANLAAIQSWLAQNLASKPKTKPPH